MQSKSFIDLPNNQILSFEDYISIYTNALENDPERKNSEWRNLIRYSKKLNNKLRDEFELEEGQRPLLVSGILIALNDDAFMASYMKESSAKHLAGLLINTIGKILDRHNVAPTKKGSIMNEYDFIKNNYNIITNSSNNPNKLLNLISEINAEVKSFMNAYQFHDILGQFYGEFLRYANGDKGLGVILTPKHITELFVEIAHVDKNSVVLDNCCGTGGFLISAMKKMIRDANNDSTKIKSIHNNQLIGIDNNGRMFCLACSNMLLRGDGKSNIHYSNCFDINKEHIVKLKPTVGFLNPPYAKNNKDLAELNFIINCLEFLEKNAICVAIVPMSCAIQKNQLRTELLTKHTLKAVMSMPDELFYPIGVVPCIMVFQAHVPHDSSVETWFGYWKDDGYVKVKNEGRIDRDNKHISIQQTWLDDFRNNRVKIGSCVRKTVTDKDDWCAETYMKTDYSKITNNDFIDAIRKYIIFKFANDKRDDFIYTSESFTPDIKIDLNISKWNDFKIDDLFDVKGAKTTRKHLLDDDSELYPYITTKSTNNGVDGFYGSFTDYGGVLTVDSTVKGVCFYQEKNFSASDHVEKLMPKFKMNQYTALFLTVIINKEQYRYSYGLKFNQKKIRNTVIKLPASNGKPDWKFMENYIKSLPCSSNLKP